MECRERRPGKARTLWRHSARAFEREPDRYKLDLPKGMKAGRKQADNEARAAEEAEQLKRDRRATRIWTARSLVAMKMFRHAILAIAAIALLATPVDIRPAQAAATAAVDYLILCAPRPVAPPSRPRHKSRLVRRLLHSQRAGLRADVAGQFGRGILPVAGLHARPEYVLG